MLTDNRDITNEYGSLNLVTPRHSTLPPQFLINGVPISGTLNTLIVTSVDDLLNNDTLNGNDIEMN